MPGCGDGAAPRNAPQAKAAAAVVPQPSPERAAAARRPTAETGYDRGHMDDRGQSLAEYALIVALIVIVALVALTLFGTQINDILSIISDTINS